MSVRIMVQLTCEGCGEVWEPATVDGGDDIYCDACGESEDYLSIVSSWVSPDVAVKWRGTFQDGASRFNIWCHQHEFGETVLIDDVGLVLTGHLKDKHQTVPT